MSGWRGCTAWPLMTWALANRPLMTLALVAWVSLVAPSLAAADKPPPVGVWLEENSEIQVLDAVFPGELLDVTAWPGGGVAVLVAPEAPSTRSPESSAGRLAPARPRALYRLTESPPAMRLVASDLSPSLTAIHGQAGGALWLGEPGRLWCLAADGPHIILESPGFDLEHIREHSLWLEPWLAVPQVGRVALYRGHGCELEYVGHAEVPISARRRPFGIDQRSLPVTGIGSAQDGVQFVVGPQVIDDRRLRTLVLDPTAEGPIAEGPTAEAPMQSTDVDADRALRSSRQLTVLESWSRLPDPMQVERQHAIQLEGRAALLVSTTRADRTRLFEKQMALVYLLGGDRQRVGAPPVLEYETENNHRRGVGLGSDDFDGDGIQDIIMSQSAGRDRDVVLDIFYGLGNGRFEPKPHRGKLDSDGAGGTFSRDVTGDGLRDLVIGRDDWMAVHSGLRGRGERLITRRPTLELEGPRRASQRVWTSANSDSGSASRVTFSGRPRVLELDAEPPSELVRTANIEGRGTLRIVRFLVSQEVAQEVAPEVAQEVAPEVAPEAPREAPSAGH